MSDLTTSETELSTLDSEPYAESELAESVGDIFVTDLNYLDHESRVQARVLAATAFPLSPRITIKTSAGEVVDQVKGYQYEDPESLPPTVPETDAPPSHEEAIERLNAKLDTLLQVKAENQALRRQNATLRVAYNRLGGDVSKLLRESGGES